MPEVTHVTLVAVSTGVRRPFSIDHAERLLRMTNSGWALPEGSDYEYDRVTGLRKKKTQKGPRLDGSQKNESFSSSILGGLSN